MEKMDLPGVSKAMIAGSRGPLDCRGREFVETLILPESESDDPIRNTSEVSRYLNDATIIFPRISSGYYHAVPNLLTGVGILGTFLGLAAGVGAASSGLSSSIPTEITAALQLASGWGIPGFFNLYCRNLRIHLFSYRGTLCHAKAP